MQPLIEIQSLSYSYPDGKQALCDVNLQVYPGEKIALIGPNGAGKSTLLLHLNGILQGSGRVSVAGMDAAPQNLGALRAMVGLVFQNPDDMLFSPTVYEDIAYGPIYQSLDAAAVEERVSAALEAVHMEAYRQRNPFHLSSGEKKRVSVAAVLSMHPQVLALDEPTAGLDPRARRELIELLAGLPQTMLVATHDLPLAARLAPRTVILNAGQVAADGPTAEILGDEGLLAANGLV
jgi:energy-coupling factor transporter ATP-binding protein EcfA2